MKIGIVYDVIYPYVIGGVQLRNWELAKRLSRRGHDVTLFGMHHWPGAATIEREGVRLCGVCPSRPLYTAAGRRAMWPPIHVASRVLPSLLGERFDLLDVANFPYLPCFPTKLAASARGARFAVTWIEVWGAYWRDYLGGVGRVAELIERACAGLGQHAAAISEMTKRDLVALGFRGPVSVIGCGVDLQHIASVPPSPVASDVIYAGRLIKEKNIDLLIQAIGLLSRTQDDLRCVIVGDGPDKERLVALTEHLGLTNYVTFISFLPRHDDVLAYLKSSRVLVNPSRREGFGIIAIEANACGLPVVAVRLPRTAIRDLVREGENGLICEPTAEGIAEALVRLLGPTPIPPSACQTAARAYDWETITLAAERFYQACLA